VADQDPTGIVRRGYDAVSQRYRGDADAPAEYRRWLAALGRRLPPAADVLDLGCGNGVPAAKALADAGHRVLGVDLSDVQIARARSLVPAATFLRADAAEVAFAPESFDAVLALYSLIHVPLPKQPALLARAAAWLRPGGWFLATLGATAWTGTEPDWLGGGAPMWWSHADAATYRSWLTAAGLTVETEEFVPEGDSGHQLFWARR
jgi:SAM-dependent methyltransferase